MVAMALLAAALMPPDASIAGGPQHTGKAPRWRTLTDSEETTTSKCIGKPVTPICAVETLNACFKRKQIELCRMAVINGGSETFDLSYSSPKSKTEYTIIKYQTIQHVPANLRDVTWIKRGDVRSEAAERSCPLTRDTCAGERSMSFLYMTRRVRPARVGGLKARLATP
jgi:hypothetical protein